MASEMESEKSKSLVARTRIKVIKRHRVKLTGGSALLRDKVEAWLARQYRERKWLLFLVIVVAVPLAIVACFVASVIKTLFNVFLVSTSMRACTYSCPLKARE